MAAQPDALVAVGKGPAGSMSALRFGGAEWGPFPAPAAPAREGAALAYDRARDQLVLFGGVLSSTAGAPLFQDTWTFQFGWQQANPLLSPSPRTEARMVYDVRRQRVVLFGGRDAAGPRNDLFEWDGANWQARTPAHLPPIAFDPALVYDGARQEVGLLLDGVASYWTYDGDDWRQATGPAPLLVAPRLAFDAARGALVAHGVHPSSALPETWEEDGSGWRFASPGVPVFGDALLGFDPVQPAVVLQSAGATSAWLPEPRAAAVPFGQPCSPLALPQRTLRAAAGSAPALGRLLRMEVPRAGSTDVAFGVLGASRTTFQGAPLPTPVPLPGSTCLLRVDFFSGLILPPADPAPWVVSVPNDLALLGVEMQAQVLFVDAFLRAVDTTNGLALRAGLLDEDRRTVETFASVVGRDPVASGDLWTAGAVQAVGLGGDGRHGSFDPTIGIQVAPQTYRFLTDSQVVPGRLTLSGADEVVTNGEFFFTDFQVPAGVTVEFRGTRPAVVRVRGEVRIEGTVDLDAPAMQTFLCRNPTPVIGNLPVAGQPGGVGGPGGGRGGDGGDRCLNAGPSANFDGKNGFDVQLPAGHAYASLASGTGGLGSPLFPAHGSTPQLAGTFTLGSIYNANFGLGGGGGGFGLTGGASQNLATFANPIPGPAAPGGVAFGLLPVPPGASSLDHFLVGGSGGGGGGSHPFLGFNIAIPQFQNDVWKAGAGGSGGGGALALRSGGNLVVLGSGILRARGGAGVVVNGDNPATIANPDPATTTTSWGVPQPGGGGSGGSLVLQSAANLLMVGTVDTSGGNGSFCGGFTVGAIAIASLAQAGAGSPGSLRFEASGALAVTGATVPTYQSAVHTGPLADRDFASGSRSVWLTPFTLDVPYYRGYELTVDVGGQTLVFSDDPALGLPADGSGPVRVRFQSARMRADGTIDPASIGPWRDYVGAEQAGYGIGHDRGNAFRFDLVIDSSLGGNPTVRQLAVRYR